MQISLLYENLVSPLCDVGCRGSIFEVDNSFAEPMSAVSAQEHASNQVLVRKGVDLKSLRL